MYRSIQRKKYGVYIKCNDVKENNSYEKNNSNEKDNSNEKKSNKDKSYYCNDVTYNTCDNYNSSNCTSKCKDNNDCDENKIISKVISTLDEKINENSDYMQNQLNIINKNILDINLKIDKLNFDNVIQKCEKHKKIYTDTETIHTLLISDDINFIYLTMIAGGGAGGIGFCKDMYYYSGGGGGSGSCIINRPVPVTKNTIIKIKIGKGSDARYDKFGQNTVVEIFDTENNFYKMFITYGGYNGYPIYDNLHCSDLPDYIVNGGKGGKSDYCIFKGCDGENGMISLPSYLCANGGNGAPSAFAKGGKGGGNFMYDGGEGGNLENLIGFNGFYGSGGGGSCPRMNIDYTKQVSGNGGNGIVIIEL